MGRLTMREHLYRAKRLDNGEWVEGFPYTFPDGDTYLHVFKGENSRGEMYFSSIAVDPSTLCQFTGKLDCRKKRLWSGDWIEATLAFEGSCLPHKGYIVYSEELCCYCSRNEAGDTPLMNLCQNTITRLGSIHDGEVSHE
jgi:hypothetical protein